MTRLPAPPVEITDCTLDDIAILDHALEPLNDVCANPYCDNQAIERHHIVRRSFTVGPKDWQRINGTPVQNVVRLCHRCHNDVTINKSRIVWDDNRFLWIDYRDRKPAPLDPHPVVLGRGAGSDDLTHSHGAPAEHPVKPGEECPTCHRRVNHPRKETSPDSKQINFRAPADAVDDFKEIEVAAARHMGVYNDKFWRYRVHLTGLTLILQEPAINLDKGAA